MKPANRKRVEELEKVCKPGKRQALLCSGHIQRRNVTIKLLTLEVDADFVVALPDNGRDDLGEEIPKGGYKVFFD